MRLRILDSGRGFGTKALFVLLRSILRQPVLDVVKLVKLVKYRAVYYGIPMPAVVQERCADPPPGRLGIGS
jgi:hypothetical protein